MNNDEPVPLVRRFSPVFSSDDDSDEQEIQWLTGSPNSKTWEEIDTGYRTVILAEAGAGKTYEMLARARFVGQQGKPSFFIRIEEIESGFEHSFDFGSPESFEQWLDSQDEAWFYLDSVDEARLIDPAFFRKAIKHFANRIRPAQQRAHVCISSRPHAWRVKSDRDLVLKHLPHTKPVAVSSEDDPGPEEHVNHSDEVLEVLVLLPLEEDDIRMFAACRSVSNIDRLIQELDRLNLKALSGRVFDLVEILDKWKADRSLGGRRELLRHNIKRRLSEPNPDREPHQVLSPEQARSGAQALAAAVILSDKVSINVPDSPPIQAGGINPQAVLADWQPAEVQNLLASAVFDDVVYGAVRFRHREVREMLAAEWFAELLSKGHSRDRIERMFFREQYGEKFVSPRLRVVLPWIVLEDQEIRNRILDSRPEIAIEGGDPALLPLKDRKKMLFDIVDRIAHGIDTGTATDSHAIARIAQPDLALKTKELIDKHSRNDNAISFLGRLVWQGGITECMPQLLDLFAEPTRSVSARISIVQAVMTCGSDSQKLALWNVVRTIQVLPREVLRELLHDAEAGDATIPPILESIERLVPYNEFEFTGLRYALHGFIDRLPIPQGTKAEQPLIALVSGFNDLLNRPPFKDEEMCRISEHFSWLLGAAVHSVERLVSERSQAAMCEPVLMILINTPDVIRRYGRDIDDYKDKLSELVPVWPELNDRLFWYNVRAVRIGLEEEGGKLNDDWQVQWRGHYWHFGSDSFDRVIEWVNSRELNDDRMVALSLAHRVYLHSEKPAHWLDRLNAAVSGDPEMAVRLDELLNPSESEEDFNWWRQKEEERKRKLERKKLKDQQRRLDWIGRLKANPDELVRNPPDLKPGEITWDQWYLLREVEGDDHRTDRIQGANWRSLIHEFGEEVADAYRDAAVAHWRHCKPGLGSEGAKTNSIPYPVYFGMTGLAIEASEVESFPTQLSSSEVRVALRYMVWELNGFPPWLKSMYQAHPTAVMEAVKTELVWELTDTDQSRNYILHDLTVHTPWLHGPLTSWLLSWLKENDPPSVDSLCQILRMLNGGCSNPDDIAALAKIKAIRKDASEHQPYWYAMWVDTDPEAGIEAVDRWLVCPGTESTSQAAQLFISALMGSHYDFGVGQRIANLQQPQYLKRLYVLMHEHIRTSEDIDRVGKGAYSPNLRDNAQNARDRLFKLLSENPGKEAYFALKELIAEHPDSNHRPGMAKSAHNRAQVDGDIESWTAEQVHEFSIELTITPATQRQLFDLTVSRITDLKNWLERGNDSQYRTWQRAEDENEIRNLVTSTLNHRRDNSFTTAQEPELPNRQRVDIWLQAPKVQLPIPIELKLLDKGWTGPKLCERLRNQLAGDYLREANERYGLMLLVWQGSSPGRRWRINGKLISVPNLCDALKQYWQSISKFFPNVADIDVLLIDLTVRAYQSDN